MKRLSNIEYLPSLFAANPLRFEKAIEKILKEGIRQVHLDIMDGDFVPNISFGPAVVAAIKLQYPALFREVHLMLSHPEKFIPMFIQKSVHKIFLLFYTIFLYVLIFPFIFYFYLFFIIIFCS